MSNVEKIFQQISKVDPGRYALRCHEAQAFYQKHHDDRSSMILDAFRYGFLKGQRAAKAAAKKKAVQA